MRTPLERFIKITCFYEYVGGSASALDRTGGDALDDVLLAAEVEHDDGDYAQHYHCHRRAHVNGAVAALEVLDMDGDGHVELSVEDKVGEEVVVPDPHYLKHADGNERGLEHRENDGEEGADRPAAVYRRGFLNFKRDALYKAREHEHRKPRAEAEVDYRDRPRRVQLQGVRRLCEVEHDHLERDDHGEHAEIVHYLAEKRADTGDVPRGHRGADKYQRRRNDRDEQAEEHGLEEGVAAEGHAFFVVCKADEGFAVRQSKGIGIYMGVILEGVYQDKDDGHEVEQRDGGKEHGQRGLAAVCFAVESS